MTMMEDSLYFEPVIDKAAIEDCEVAHFPSSERGQVTEAEQVNSSLDPWATT